jgi:RNA polymerase sigma-70 factor (ECF subfamily)
VIDIQSRMEQQPEAESAAGIDEAAIVARAKAMDDDAWEYLLHSYYPRLQIYIRNRIGDHSTAEDLASQVFEEAVVRIKDYEWRGLPFGAWLFRIARNLSTDHLRKRERRAGVFLQPQEQLPLGHEMEQQLQAQQLQQAMLALNDEQRQVISLRFMSGLSTEDTGVVLNKSTGAVKAIQHRALRTMRRTLDQIDPTFRGEQP